MAYAAGAKILKDAGETCTDVETNLSQALVEVENNGGPDLKAPLKELYFKVWHDQAHKSFVRIL